MPPKDKGEFEELLVTWLGAKDWGVCVTVAEFPTFEEKVRNRFIFRCRTTPVNMLREKKKEEGRSESKGGVHLKTVWLGYT